MRYWKAAVLVLCLSAAGVAVWMLRSASGVPSPPPRVAVPQLLGGPVPVEQAADSVRWDSPGQGMLLMSSVPLGNLNLPQQSRLELGQCMAEWFSAYGDQRPEPFVSLLQSGGITPPPSWADGKAAQELWAQSLAGIRGVDIDPSKSFAQIFNLVSLNDPQIGSQRCGRRDGARPFLTGPQARQKPGVEVVLMGSVLDSQTETRVQVSIAIAFAWNPEVNKWVVIRTCLKDFPNAYEGAPPVL